MVKVRLFYALAFGQQTCGAPGLFLTLRSRMTPGRDWRTMCGAGDWAQVNCMQDKRPTFCGSLFIFYMWLQKFSQHLLLKIFSSLNFLYWASARLSVHKLEGLTQYSFCCTGLCLSLFSTMLFYYRCVAQFKVGKYNALNLCSTLGRMVNLTIPPCIPWTGNASSFSLLFLLSVVSIFTVSVFHLPC